MKTKKNHQVISSDRLDLTIPAGWKDVTPRQFKAICSLLAADIWPESLGTLLFLRLAGLRYIGRHDAHHGIYEHRPSRIEDKARKRSQSGTGPVPELQLSSASAKRRAELRIISDELLASALDTIDWILQPDDTLLTRPDLLRAVHSSAIPPDLRTLRFADWIAIDTTFTVLIEQSSRPGPVPELQLRSSTRQAPAMKVAKKLWPKMPARSLTTWKQTAAILWMTAIKCRLQKQYPHIYAQPDQNDTAEIFPTGPQSRREAIQAQIRALTKGDITIEEKVLAAPMHRAIAELDQLAREFQELQKIKNK